MVPTLADDAEWLAVREEKKMQIKNRFPPNWRRLLQKVGAFEGWHHKVL